jgi:hypothetical protein
MAVISDVHTTTYRYHLKFRPNTEGGKTDPEYIAGDNTMDQLLVKPVERSGKVIARGRIQRLKAGVGDPITGQRIMVRRHAQYGFGFAISGNSPTYVYGARFPTEIYTRGCHWIPRMFA